MASTSRPRIWLRSVALGSVLAGVATLPAALPGRFPHTTVALVYVLAVLVASAFGGFPAGLTASVVSFLALNFFFTLPLHTLAVERAQDVVALGVFVIVSVIVGSLLSRALSQRFRAERREREARLLQQVSTRLLSGEPLRGVLESFARAVTDLFELARCEVAAEIDDHAVAIQGAAVAGGEPQTFPLLAGGRSVGHIRMIPGVRALGEEEQRVIRAFASQLGLAVEGLRLADEADRARVEAETNRLRAALFSSVTHDLRTPLASIVASVTSLQGGGDDLSAEDRADHLETIRQEADRLNRLVGNLMHLSRIRAGALVPEKTPAAIGEVIEGVVARLRPGLERHDVRLLLREDLPPTPIDVVQIDQVLTNLLENAASFSQPGGEIRIYANRWRDTVEVKVADRGPGIPPEERERVMEPFMRGDGSAGSGLGLSIARAIVESHGGRLWIRETPGGGATVAFRLPIR
jgi:two-component system, OmpR family, sensor histidine kinase KdpD